MLKWLMNTSGNLLGGGSIQCLGWDAPFDIWLNVAWLASHFQPLSELQRVCRAGGHLAGSHNAAHTGFVAFHPQSQTLTVWFRYLETVWKWKCLGPSHMSPHLYRVCQYTRQTRLYQYPLVLLLTLSVPPVLYRTHRNLWRHSCPLCLSTGWGSG